jgi:hypothetical protein
MKVFESTEIRADATRGLRPCGPRRSRVWRRRSGPPGVAGLDRHCVRLEGGPGPRPYTVLQPDPSPLVYFQGFVPTQGVRKILLVNKRAVDEELRIAGAAGGTVQMVDESTSASPLPKRLGAKPLRLPQLAVAVVTLGR